MVPEVPISVLRYRLKSRCSAPPLNCSPANSVSIPSFYPRLLPFHILVSTQPTDSAKMTKRKIRADAPDPSQDVSAPSSAKKPKNRPSRVAAQRARSALQEEAKPESPCDLSEDEVLRMLSAKNRRKSASSAKQAANTPSTKQSGTVPAPKASAPQRAVKNPSSSGSLNSSDETETVELSGPSTPSVSSGGAPSKKKAARPKRKDSAIGDYFHSSPRPKKTGDRIPPSESSRPKAGSSPAQGCVEISSDSEEPVQVPSRGSAATNNSKSRNSPHHVPTGDAVLEQPSDDDDDDPEPRGGRDFDQVDEDTNAHEGSDDEVPDEFGVQAGTSTVVKAETSAGASHSVTPGGDERSLTSLPVSKRTTTGDIDVFEVSDTDEQQSGQHHGSGDDGGSEEHGHDVDDAIVKCLTKLVTRSGVQEGRTRTILKEVNNMRNLLDDVLFRVMTVESHVEDVRANNVGSNNSSNGKRGSKKKDGGIAGWERIMSEKFQYVDCYFPPALWTEAILHSAFEHIHTSTSSSWGREECIVALSGVLFARKNHGKKSLFETDIGRSASAFRKLLLEKLLDLAREGKYSITAPTSGVSLEPKPEWLGKHEKEMYIDKDHIKAGQQYHESKASNTPEYNRRIAVGNGAAPNRNDFASYIMIHLYDVMNHLFIERRKRVRSAFCEAFGYLFHPWSKVKDVHVTDSSLRLAWRVPFEDIVKVPEEALRDAETEDKHGKSADRGNRVIFDFIAGKKELWLFVAHDIILARGVQGADGKRRIPGTERDIPKLYRRWMNMLAPACEFFMALAGVDDDVAPHQVMRFHSRSTSVLYHVGLFLRDVYDLHQSRDILDGFENGARRVTVGKEAWKNVLDFYDIFNTTDGGNDKAVVNATCAVYEEEYNRKHKYTKAERLARARHDAATSTGGPSGANSGHGTGKKIQGSDATSRASEQGEKKISSSQTPGKAPAKSIACDGGHENSVTTDRNSDDEDEAAIQRKVHARVNKLQLDDAVDDDPEQAGGKDSTDNDNDDTDRRNGDHSESGQRPRAQPSNGLIVPDTRVTSET